MEHNQQAYEQAARVLPIRLRQEALSLPPADRGRAEELRLRCGQPLTAVLPEGERTLGREPVTGRDLEQLLELASRASVHTVLDQLRRGYLTVEGGHRVGLCGTAVLAGATFAVTHVPPLIPLTVVLAIPGFLGWILPYFLYRAMVRRRTKVVNELMERKYDEIYEICEKGHQLLI